MPTNRSKQLPWVRERQKSGAPESSEETSVDTLWFLSRWRKKNSKSFSRRNLKNAHPRILLQVGLEVNNFLANMDLREVGPGPEGQEVCWEGQRESPWSETHSLGWPSWGVWVGPPFTPARQKGRAPDGAVAQSRR